jgi:hypothetical protein
MLFMMLLLAKFPKKRAKLAKEIAVVFEQKGSGPWNVALLSNLNYLTGTTLTPYPTSSPPRSCSSRFPDPSGRHEGNRRFVLQTPFWFLLVKVLF